MEISNYNLLIPVASPVYIYIYITAHALTSLNLVNVVMTYVQTQNLLHPGGELVSQYGHEVIGQIDLLQPIRYPRIVGERSLGHERDLVAAEIDPLQGQAIVEKAVGLVVQFFQLVARKIQRSQRDQALERPVRDPGNFIVGQIQRQQLQQTFEGADAHLLYPIVGQIQLEHYRQTPERRLPQLG